MKYLMLFLSFFKMGLFTFGGGYAMLPLMQAENAARGWMSDAELIDFIAISESTPGPFALNMATFIGTCQGGLLGALCSTLGVVLPSFIVILIVATIYERFKKSSTVKGVMSGLKPAAIGLIASAVLTVGKAAFFKAGFSLEAICTPYFFAAAALFIVTLILALKKVNPILIVVISAAVGLLLGCFVPGIAEAIV